MPVKSMKNETLLIKWEQNLNAYITKHQFIQGFLFHLLLLHRPHHQQRSAKTSLFSTIRWHLESYRAHSVLMWVWYRVYLLHNVLVGSSNLTLTVWAGKKQMRMFPLKLPSSRAVDRWCQELQRGVMKGLWHIYCHGKHFFLLGGLQWRISKYSRQHICLFSQDFGEKMQRLLNLMRYSILFEDTSIQNQIHFMPNLTLQI